MTPDVTNPPPVQEAPADSGTPGGAPGPAKPKKGFGEDFRRFFVGGLKALLPTLITLWLLFWVWNFLWQNIGRHVIWAIKWAWVTLQDNGILPERFHEPAGRIRQILYEGDGVREPEFRVKLLGVGLAILLVYVVGVFVGNLIGRTMWRITERAVMRLPLIRAIYPSVKQVTDFLLTDRSARGAAAAGQGSQFQRSRVVAVQARHQGVWSIGLVTNAGYGPLNNAIQGDMLTVFIPSSPTAVAGYVVVAHREQVVELPLTVEEALRLLISGGVLVPQGAQHAPAGQQAGVSHGANGTPGPLVLPGAPVTSVPVDAIPAGAPGSTTAA